MLQNKDEWFGVNTPQELEQANQLFNKQMSNKQINKEKSNAFFYYALLYG